MTQYFGKFRATVLDNQDPLSIGRILLRCPTVLGDDVAEWAEACLPFTTPNTGIVTLPAVGAAVWVEFEGGDARYPIWTGARLDASSPWPESEPVALRGDQGERIEIDQASQTIAVIHPNGTSVIIDGAGVRVSAPGAVVVDAPDVTVHAASLRVDGTVSASTVIASSGMISPSYGPG